VCFVRYFVAIVVVREEKKHREGEEALFSVWE
jgi:hypothetical protein